MGKIIWLASYPKSGNTWLRAFLHNLFRRPDAAYDINRLIDFCTSESAIGWYHEVGKRPVAELSRAEIAQLRPAVHARLTEIFPDNVFVKTHNALVEESGVPMITMAHTAGAIYVVRNPLDVCISFADHYARTIDQAIEDLNRPGMMTDVISTHVPEVFGSWSENVESWTARPSPALHVMRYEDMLAEPERTFGAVTRFLGLNTSTERLRHAIELSSFDKLRQQEEQRGFKERSTASERFFRVGRAGQWRTKLTPAQVEAVVRVHEKQMRRFGYLPLPADYRSTEGAA
jgi:Sulfotransferase domain